jgi:CRP-like cAMP-binding protein
MRVRDRDEDILIEERTAGQTLGWSALIPPNRFTLTATALVQTEVIALPRTALLEHFARTPEVGYAVTRNVAAVVGQRLQVFQAMWLREMQRVVKMGYA